MFAFELCLLESCTSGGNVLIARIEGAAAFSKVTTVHPRWIYSHVF